MDFQIHALLLERLMRADPNRAPCRLAGSWTDAAHLFGQNFRQAVAMLRKAQLLQKPRPSPHAAVIV
jgi:hypothetical protein